MVPVEQPTFTVVRVVLAVFLIVRQPVELHQAQARLHQIAEFVLQLQAASGHVVRCDGGVEVRRNVPVIRQHKFKAIAAAIFCVRDQETGATFITDRQLQVRAVEHRHAANFKAGVPDFRHLLFAVVDHFGTDHAPAVVAGQTGGKGAVFQNGITVGTAHLHLVGIATPLTAYHLVVTLIDVGIFVVQVRPGFRAFQLDLIVAVVHVTGSGHGAHRIGLPRILRLVQFHLFGGQGAVALFNIHVTGEQRTFRIIRAGVIGVNGDGQAVGIAADQRFIINRNAKHALLSKVSQSVLAVECRPNQCGQQCWETFFHTRFWCSVIRGVMSGKRSETISLICVALVLNPAVYLRRR
ncbi:hypothetical protein D3C79_480350 [compost metagenome]